MFFQKLNSLALQSPLVITVAADATTGKMTLVITPKVDKDTAEAALRQPLTATATPEEFDREFYDVLERYSNSRKSLIEQVEATMEVLDAAKKAQVDKASKATAKSGQTAPKPTPATANEAREGVGNGIADAEPDDTRENNMAVGSVGQGATLFG